MLEVAATIPMTSATINTTDIPPNQTLFCYNLNTKISLRELKSCLFEFFSPFGKILDIVAAKADPKKRGNAFIVFADITAATTALRSLHSRSFLGRPLGINYAKSKSDKVAILDGTFKIRRKKFESRLPGEEDIMFTSSTRSEHEERIDGVSATTLSKDTLPSSISGTAAGATLFVENLPNIMNEGALSVLFNQYPGFQEARLVPGRGIGFVDFNNELQAELAMQGLNGFLVTPEAALKISIAKK